MYLCSSWLRSWNKDTCILVPWLRYIFLFSIIPCHNPLYICCGFDLIMEMKKNKKNRITEIFLTPKFQTAFLCYVSMLHYKYNHCKKNISVNHWGLWVACFMSHHDMLSLIILTLLIIKKQTSFNLQLTLIKSVSFHCYNFIILNE